MADRLLVTGGAGFIGSSITRRLVADGYAVRVLDNLSSGKRENLEGVDAELVEGDVRVKRARELIWVPARKGMALSAGDQIKTSSRAAAQIIYFNGTITTVTSGSLMEIKELYDNPSTKVQQVREQLRSGRIAATTQKPSVEGSFHEITTNNSVAVTEERSSLEVAYDEDDQSTKLEVHSGRARIATAGGDDLHLQARCIGEAPVPHPERTRLLRRRPGGRDPRWPGARCCRRA